MHFVLVYKHLGRFLIQRHLGLKICIGLGTAFFSWFLIQRNTLYMFCFCLGEGERDVASEEMAGGVARSTEKRVFGADVLNPKVWTSTTQKGVSEEL